MKKPKETPKPKSRAPLLPPEALEKLSRDSYCFNLEHDKEIERLNGELGRLKAQIGVLQGEKDHVAKEVEQRVAQRELELKTQKAEIQDQLDEAQKRTAEVQRDLEDAKARVSDLEAQLASSEEASKKKFRNDGLCFDIMHRMIQGRAMHLLAVPELFVLGIYLLSRSPNPADDILVAVSKDMVCDVDAAKKVVSTQQARKLGEDLRNHPVMLSLFQKNPNRGI